MLLNQDHMAKQKRNDVAAKIDAEVIRVARIVAAYRNQTVAEYLSEKLKPLVEKDLARYAKQASEEALD